MLISVFLRKCINTSEKFSSVPSSALANMHYLRARVLSKKEVKEVAFPSPFSQ